MKTALVFAIAANCIAIISLLCLLKAKKKKGKQFPEFPDYCPDSVKKFVKTSCTPKFSIEEQLEIAREKKRPRLKLECVRKNECPDCKVKGKILAGPCGGMCMNVKCGNCGSRFNITPFGVERI